MSIYQVGHMLRQLTLIPLLLLTFSIGAHETTQTHSAKKVDDYHQTRCGDWRSHLIKEEGKYIELGGELLIMTSTLTPTYSDEMATLSNQIGLITERVDFNNVESIKPDYNLGFAVDLRYRPPTKNDVGLYYKYIRNNGSDSFNNMTTLTIDADNTIFSQDFIQDDRGSLHSHIHIIDFMFGRTYPISKQSVLRLAGGLSYQDWNISFQYCDQDTRINKMDQVETQRITIELDNVQKNSIWMLGPRFALDFEYYFLPSCWRQDFNLFFEFEFALLYGKEWSKGNGFERNATISNGQLTQSTIFFSWRNQPKFEFFPNINLNMGMKYKYHTKHNVIIEFAGGYRILSYWELNELSRVRTFRGSQGDAEIINLFSIIDDHLAYTGPYVRFSIAY